MGKFSSVPKLHKYIVVAFVALLLLGYNLPYFIQIYSSSQNVLLSYFQEWSDSKLYDGRYQTMVYNKTLQPPGVILKWKGGIGNQLFDYACSYALARRLKWPLYIIYDDVNGSSLLHRQFGPYHREFALDQFSIPFTSLNVIRSSMNLTMEGSHHISDEELLYSPFNYSSQFLTAGGYCQSELYWREYEQDIRRMFQPRLESINLTKLAGIIAEIEETESVAVHVRRGDFTLIEGYFVPISYQRKAIPLMVDVLNRTRGVTKPTFFVFSDDIMHTKRKLKGLRKRFRFVFVKETTSIEDFYLMTICKHIIFPNSTFSWWAAYLNNNKKKVVIASAFNPKFWNLFNHSSEGLKFNMKLYGNLFHTKEWIVVDPFIGGLV